MEETKVPVSNDDGQHAAGEILDFSEGYNPAEEKAVLRKIDMVILPFVRAQEKAICETVCVC